MKKIGILPILICLSCGDRNIIDNEDLKQSKLEVIESGDVTSYIKLTNFYDQEENYYELLPYSLRMIKLKETGYHDFFDTYLKIKFGNELVYDSVQKLDKEEQIFLIHILTKGALNDDFECRKILADFYKKGIVVAKDSIIADSLNTIK